MQERRVVVSPLSGHRDPPGGTRHPISRALVAVAVAAGVVLVDQLTKWWALGALVFDAPRHVFGPLSWTLTINKGAAFGLGTGVTPILEVIAVVLVTALAVAAGRAGRATPASVAVAIGLLLGGALSNLGDRAFRSFDGGVVDWIDALRIGNHDRWPIFNLADAAITVGAILLALSASRMRRPADSDGSAAGGGRASEGTGSGGTSSGADRSSDPGAPVE